MLIVPNSLYEIKKSNGMLKIKKFHDEALIIGYENRTGKYKDVLSAIIVKGVNELNLKLVMNFRTNKGKKKLFY